MAALVDLYKNYIKYSVCLYLHFFIVFIDFWLLLLKGCISTDFIGFFLHFVLVVIFLDLLFYFHFRSTNLYRTSNGTHCYEGWTGQASLLCARGSISYCHMVVRRYCDTAQWICIISVGFVLISLWILPGIGTSVLARGKDTLYWTSPSFKNIFLSWKAGICFLLKLVLTSNSHPYLSTVWDTDPGDWQT